MMEQLSKIGFLVAHQKYRDIEMYRELCDYQDTNLTPPEVAIFARAKAEGRLAVLPWLRGQKLYIIAGTSFTAKRDIIEAEFEYWFTGENGLIGCAWTENKCSRKFTETQIGHTVFLTTEAAEAEKERLEHE